MNTSEEIILLSGFCHLNIGSSEFIYNTMITLNYEEYWFNETLDNRRVSPDIIKLHCILCKILGIVNFFERPKCIKYRDILINNNMFIPNSDSYYGIYQYDKIYNASLKELRNLIT